MSKIKILLSVLLIVYIAGCAATIPILTTLTSGYAVGKEYLTYKLKKKELEIKLLEVKND